MTSLKGVGVGLVKSISGPLFGAEGAENFENWPTFMQKNDIFPTFLRGILYFCPKYILKSLKTAILGHFDK